MMANFREAAGLMPSSQWTAPAEFGTRKDNICHQITALVSLLDGHVPASAQPNIWRDAYIMALIFGLEERAYCAPCKIAIPGEALSSRYDPDLISLLTIAAAIHAPSVCVWHLITPNYRENNQPSWTRTQQISENMLGQKLPLPDWNTTLPQLWDWMKIDRRNVDTQLTHGTKATLDNMHTILPPTVITLAYRVYCFVEKHNGKRMSARSKENLQCLIWKWKNRWKEEFEAAYIVLDSLVRTILQNHQQRQHDHSNSPTAWYSTPKATPQRCAPANFWMKLTQRTQQLGSEMGESTPFTNVLPFAILYAPYFIKSNRSPSLV
eukprot:TRINITY_DN58037_c0_g2_i1.p1 TRINITY_DN58037_c0_g2~~TRINITY_DN58037_c0_g2_i1.p1  ORF type:complete len:322 (+),score=9.20 TRINITY_DN58037_c0_g2_i1:1-966(+)